MNAKTTATQTGRPVFKLSVVITAFLVLLKVTGILGNVSWLWILSPLWISALFPFILILLLIVIGVLPLIVGLFIEVIDSIDTKRREKKRKERLKKRR